MSHRGHPAWVGPASAAAALLLRAIAATWRFDRRNAPDYVEALRGGERFVYLFWHARILPLVVARRGEGIAVLVSRHRDGEIITRVIEAFGYVTARGSSTRGGEIGVRELLGWARDGRHLAVTPDGPRGPAEQVKPGVVFLATRTGRRLVPIAAAADRAWRLRSWDRFVVPWPFTRIVVLHGAPIAPSRGESEDSLAGRMQSAVAALQAEADALAGARA